jgi:hypothetical protein
MNTYRLSGRFTPIGIIAGIACGLAAGLPLAFIYAWGIIRIPEAKLASITTLAYGAALGAAVAFGARWGKVRNAQVGGFIAFWVAAASLYVSWAFWIKDVFHTFANQELRAVGLMQHPNALWRIIRFVNQYGTWGLSSGSATKGTELWVIWALEATAVLVIAMLAAVSVLKLQPFCETCQIWCTSTEKLCLLPVSDVAQTKLLLQQHDLSFLQKLGAGDKKTTNLGAELHSCPNCRELNTLTLRQTFIQQRKFGSPGVKVVTLANKLLVSRLEADTFRQTAQGIKQLSKAAHA